MKALFAVTILSCLACSRSQSDGQAAGRDGASRFSSVTALLQDARLGKQQELRVTVPGLLIMDPEDQNLYTSMRLRPADPKLHAIGVSPGECVPREQRAPLTTPSPTDVDTRGAFLTLERVKQFNGKYVKVTARVVPGVGFLQGEEYLCFIETVEPLNARERASLDALPLEFGSSCKSLSAACSGKMCRDAAGHVVSENWIEAVSSLCRDNASEVQLYQRCTNRNVVDLQKGDARSVWYYDNDGKLRGMRESQLSGRAECFGDVWELRAQSCRPTACPGFPLGPPPVLTSDRPLTSPP